MKIARLLLACMLSVASAGAMPQQYPTKPVRVLLHFPSGGSTDVVTRILANAPPNASWRPLIEQGVAALSGPRPAQH